MLPIGSVDLAAVYDEPAHQGGWTYVALVNRDSVQGRHACSVRQPEAGDKRRDHEEGGRCLSLILPRTDRMSWSGLLETDRHGLSPPALSRTGDDHVPAQHDRDGAAIPRQPEEAAW